MEYLKAFVREFHCDEQFHTKLLAICTECADFPQALLPAPSPVMIRSFCYQTILLFSSLLLPALADTALTPPPEAAPVKEPAPSTQEMGALLLKAYATTDLTNADWGFNDRRARMIRKHLEQISDPKAKIPVQFALAKELLADGQNAETLESLDELEKAILEQKIPLLAAEIQSIRMMRVQAFLRIGETDNCCADHNQDSCLLPLRGGALYRHQEGPLEAIKLLTEQLEEVPNDMTARWLMNIAYMTMGTYPSSVPTDWLIDPKVFDSDYDIGRFHDVAGPAGLDTYGLSGGCIVSDFDGDSLLDVVRSDFGITSQMRFFHNNGDGTFADRTDMAGLTGEVGGLNLIDADFNNDGYLDILVLRGGWLGKAGRFPMSLIRNNGDGTFTDVTARSGLLRPPHPTQTAVWFDYDGDGWLDLYVGNETTDPSEAHPCELFHNNQDGTFSECAHQSGVKVVGFIKGVVSADYNNDGRPDLYISQMSGTTNLLLRNEGPRDPANLKSGWKFSNVTKEAGLADAIFSFPCWFFDYDNDGWQDIFVCGYKGGVDAMVAEFIGQPSEGIHPRLYHNNGDGTFTNKAASMGLDMTLMGMSGNFGDLDNDGYLDFYVGTGGPLYSQIVPNKMFRNDRGKMFQDVTTSGGFGNVQKGHGVAFADINNNGQQDIYAVLGGAFTGDKYYSALYANPGHDNQWVNLKLEGVQSNRSAMGARVRVTVATPTGDRTIHRTVSTGGSFGASPLRLLFGLGDATSIKQIEIFWPATGKTQTLPGVPMKAFYKIKEGAAAATLREMPTYQLKGVTAQ